MPDDSERGNQFSGLFLCVTGVDFGRGGKVEHVFLSDTPPDTRANYNPSELVAEFLANVYRPNSAKKKAPKPPPRTVKPDTLR